MLESIGYIGTCIITLEAYSWIACQLVERLAPTKILEAHTNFINKRFGPDLVRVLGVVCLEEMVFRLPCVILSTIFPKYQVLFVTLQAIVFGLSHVSGLLSDKGYHWSIILMIIGGGGILGSIAIRTPGGFLIACLCHFVHNVLCYK